MPIFWRRFRLSTRYAPPTHYTRTPPETAVCFLIFFRCIESTPRLNFPFLFPVTFDCWFDILPLLFVFDFSIVFCHLFCCLLDSPCNPHRSDRLVARCRW